MDCARCEEKIEGQSYNWRGRMVHLDCWEAYKHQAIEDVRKLDSKSKVAAVGFSKSMEYTQVEVLQ